MLKKSMILFSLIVTLLLGTSVWGMETYTNEGTGYMAYCIDDAGLITSKTDLTQVMDAMDDITRFGNVVFLSNTAPHNNSVSDFADASYEKYFGTSDGVLFLIDMYDREIYISCSGKLAKQISDYDSYTITDNIYTYASQEKFASCAIYAFDQLSHLLNGKRLASPMRLVTNAFFAFLVAFLLNYILVKAKSRPKLPTFDSLISSNRTENIQNKHDVVTKVTRTKHSSSSSGGHSGGGHSGGHSGGGHSGGGHRF